MKSWSFRRPGRPVRLAGMGCLILLAALIPGVRSAAALQRVDTTLGYACQGPSGQQQARLRIEAVFPSTGKAGAAVRPEDVRVTATIPAAALPGSGDGSRTVGGAANLTTLFTTGRVPTAVEWQGMTVRPVKAAEGGDLVLAASGPVPTTMAATGGDIVVSAGALSLALTLRTPAGAPADPPSLALSCTPNLGQDATLAVIPLDGDAAGRPGPGGRDTTGPAVGGTGSGGARTLQELCPPQPEGGFNKDLERRHPFPEPPPGVSLFENPEWACALVDGLSNVNKLKGAAAVKGEASVMAGAWIANSPGTALDYTQQRSYGKPLIEPTQATFLTFGFMPTTAAIEVEPVGNMNIVSVGPSDQNPNDRATNTTIYADVHLRIRDAKVNGTPLDVGPRCRTAQPVEMILTGNDRVAFPYTLKEGGRVIGTMDIPRFAGCGVGENLDRLFTASVSGPGNHVQLTQGPLCYVLQNSVCPMQRFGWTVRGDGTWSATSTTPFRVSISGNSFNCGSRVDGSFRIGTGLPGRGIGSVTGWQLSNCTVTTGSMAGRAFTIEPLRLPWAINVDFFTLPPDGTPENGTLRGSIRYPAFRATSTSPTRCTFDIQPRQASLSIPISRYDNATGTMATGAVAGTNFQAVNPQGCPAGFGGNVTLFSMNYPGLGHVLTFP